MIGPTIALVAGILRAVADGLERDAGRTEPQPIVLHVQQLTVHAGPELGRTITERARETLHTYRRR